MRDLQKAQSVMREASSILISSNADDKQKIEKATSILISGEDNIQNLMDIRRIVKEEIKEQFS